MEKGLRHGRPLSRTVTTAEFSDRAAFVHDNTTLQEVPDLGGIRLHLADAMHDLWHKTHAELDEIGVPPPFWAFAWAGGQGLARHVLAHPELVRGRQVLDFATGSGMVAIAAFQSGAVKVIAADIDPFSAAAAGLNAVANGVTIAVRLGDLIGTDEGWDVVLAGDIFYDRAFADRFEPWLRALSGRGATVVVGDPGRAYLPKDLEYLATHFIAVSRDIEDADEKRCDVWRYPAS